jgi:hypothetical protein
VDSAKTGLCGPKDAGRREKKPGFADSACVVGFSRAAATACALFLYQSRKHRVKHSRAFSFFREFS